jgi:hypothetical protein
MIVFVFHNNEPAAMVKIPADIVKDTDALEYAYRWTNNISGSWSYSQKFEDGLINEDYNENVKCFGTNPVYNGKEYGLRSTMVGDEMILVKGGTSHNWEYWSRWEVGSFGFTHIEDSK